MSEANRWRRYRASGSDRRLAMQFLALGAGILLICILPWILDAIGSGREF